MAWLICAMPAFAQQPARAAQTAPASVSGKVTAATGQQTTNILAGITIKLTSTASGSASQTTATDSEGRYEFAHQAPGNYKLEISVDGFQPWAAAVSLKPGQTITEDVALQINSVQEQIQVQGEATEIATESVSATATVTDQQLEALP